MVLGGCTLLICRLLMLVLELCLALVSRLSIYSYYFILAYEGGGESEVVIYLWDWEGGIVSKLDD